jgi:hypothetical protein
MKVDQAVYNGYQQFCNFSVTYFFDTGTISLRNVYTGWSGVIFALPIAFFFLWGILHYVFIFVYFCTICLRIVPYTTLEFRPLNSTANGEDVTVILVYMASLRNLGVRDKSTWASFPIIFIFSTLIYLYLFFLPMYLNLFFSSSFCDPVKSGANCLLCPPLPSYKRPWLQASHIDLARKVLPFLPP